MYVCLHYTFVLTTFENGINLAIQPDLTSSSLNTTSSFARPIAFLQKLMLIINVTFDPSAYESHTIDYDCGDEDDDLKTREATHGKMK